MLFQIKKRQKSRTQHKLAGGEEVETLDYFLSFRFDSPGKNHEER